MQEVRQEKICTSELFIFERKITIYLRTADRVWTCRFTNLFAADHTMKLGKLSKYLRAFGESTCDVPLLHVE